MSVPVTKLSKLKAFVFANQWREAILLAAKFQDLGGHKKQITAAREAYLRPDFQRQIGKDPAALIEAGKEAIRERYDV